MSGKLFSLSSHPHLICNRRHTRTFLMKPLFSCFGIALLICAISPSFAESPSNAAMPVNARTQPTSQVTIIKRDARENVIAVQQVNLAKAIVLASELVPDALSENDSDIKSLTITYQ
jgi:hypothetical protein